MFGRVMDIIFLGTNNIGMEIYEWLCERESVNVRGMITHGDQLDVVDELEPELLISSGFRDILPPEILETPSRGCINLHPGYLPTARGMNPNVWSIVEGIPAGATLHYMDQGIDTGDIIARRRVNQSFEDTGRDLYERIERAAFELFVKTWSTIERGEAPRQSQSESETTYHSMDDFNDLCQIQPNERYSAKELIDVLRALTFPPFDNACIEVDGERYYVDVDVTHESDTSDSPKYGVLGSYDWDS